MNEKQLQLCSFEQSKRLKQLGFDYPCFEFYYEDGELGHHFDGNCDAYFPDNFNKEDTGCYLGDLEIFSAPPVALALKWFRDEKNIYSWIETHFYAGNKIKYRGFIGVGINEMTNIFDTYESAESVLLDELLEILENNNN